MNINVYCRLADGRVAVYRQTAAKGVILPSWGVGVLQMESGGLTGVQIVLGGHSDPVGCPFSSLGVPVVGRCPLCGEDGSSWRGLGGAGVSR